VTSRRAFLLGGLSLCAMATAPLRALGVQGRSARFAASPFTLGVASGDPWADGFVLWTRLAPDPLNGGGVPREPVEVIWEIAADDRMSDIVRRGRAAALPEWAHSVHVEAAGLQPDRVYWYRFRAGGHESPIGRSRTLPRASADVARLRVAFASCQQYEMGYFTALRHLAGEDVDLVLHLGDYIYEGASQQNRIRRHHGPEIKTLDDYRTRYAQYRTDPDLQAAHAAHPFVVTWDDHEVDNNYAGELSEAQDPILGFLRRRAAAYQAYYEHMPLRRTSLPRGASSRIYRGFAYGTLAAFSVLDTRQYRTNQPCGDGAKPLCPDVFSSDATMLGAEQERWLFARLTRATARWNVLPQQVMVAPVDRGPGAEQRFAMDQWSGYSVPRDRLLKTLAERRTPNPIVLTGDIHTNWVNDLHLNFADPASPVVATEFVGTSITSGGDGSDEPVSLASLQAENPFVKFHNGQRGYVRCEFTPGAMTADYRVVDYVTRPGSPVRTRASFVVENRRPGAVPA
jgi:alkaline phosphatase D